MAWYRWQGDDLILALRVQPRAGRTAFGEIHGAERKVRLKAPPVDGRANDELLRFLAESFGVPRAAITLISGAGARSKQLRVRQPSRLPSLLGLERPPHDQ
jgi:hypothetical protein